MQKKEYKRFFYSTIQYYHDKNVIITTKTNCLWEKPILKLSNVVMVT